MEYLFISSAVAEACFSMLVACRISIQDRADRWSRSISPIWPSSPSCAAVDRAWRKAKGDEKGLLQIAYGRTQRLSSRFVGKLFSQKLPECYPTRAVDQFATFFCGTVAPQGNIAVCLEPENTIIGLRVVSLTR